MTKKYLFIATLAVAGLANSLSAMEQQPNRRQLFRPWITPMQYNDLFYKTYIQDLAHAHEMKLGVEKERDQRMQQQQGLWSQFTNWWNRENPQKAFDRELEEISRAKERKIEELAREIEAYFDNWENRYSFDLPRENEQKVSQKPVGQKLKALHRLDDFLQNNKGQYDWSAATRPTNNLNTKRKIPQEVEREYEKTKKEEEIEELARKTKAYFENWEEKYKF